MSIHPLRVVGILCDQDNLEQIPDETVKQLQANPDLLKQALQVAFTVGKHAAFLDIRKAAQGYANVESTKLTPFMHISE